MEGDPEGDEREDLVLEDQLARWGMGIGRKHLYLHPILDTRISVRQVRASKMRGGGGQGPFWTISLREALKKPLNL